jgi:hypothetical protein
LGEIILSGAEAVTEALICCMSAKLNWIFRGTVEKILATKTIVLRKVVSTNTIRVGYVFFPLTQVGIKFRFSRTILAQSCSVQRRAGIDYQVPQLLHRGNACYDDNGSGIFAHYILLVYNFFFRICISVIAA